MGRLVDLVSGTRRTRKSLIHRTSSVLSNKYSPLLHLQLPRHDTESELCMIGLNGHKGCVGSQFRSEAGFSRSQFLAQESAGDGFSRSLGYQNHAQ